jgi:hypothetical protein
MTESAASTSIAPAADPFRTVSRVLRLFGLVDLCALFAVVVPHAWLSDAARAAGLGGLPADPVAGYLARSASLMYALHGATVFFISFDVRRYWPLIRCLALLSPIHGAIVLGLDIAEGMPIWWTCLEGPAFAATGLAVLGLQRRAELQVVPPGTAGRDDRADSLR